jgi:hypothetical protein
VAQETGWDIDRVTRYAEPPLRERAYVAQCASEVQLHQARGSATLQVVVGNALGLKPDELNWDSSYVDGQWLVQLLEPGKLEIAHWSYEPAGKSVNPLNPRARVLMGLEPTRESHAGSSRESTIIIDTTSTISQPRIALTDYSESEENIITPVKLSAVPELLAIEEPEAIEPLTPIPQEPRIPQEPSAQVTKKKKGRAKVPSWDEILFGASSTED